jgi:hypothetical protein
LKRDINPAAATFEMAAVGPLFAECDDRAAHDRCRDSTGAIERAVGEWLTKRGYRVLSVDRTKAPVDPRLLARVKRHLASAFPPRQPAEGDA